MVMRRIIEEREAKEAAELFMELDLNSAWTWKNGEPPHKRVAMFGTKEEVRGFIAKARRALDIIEVWNERTRGEKP